MQCLKISDETENYNTSKSRWYYIFWGLATISVVWGQIYVGTGYRIMANQMIELLNKVDGVLLYKEDKPYF